MTVGVVRRHRDRRPEGAGEGVATIDGDDGVDEGVKGGDDGHGQASVDTGEGNERGV